MRRVGIDTGGTYTDFVVEDAAGLRAFKLPSTPHRPEEALISGVSRIGSSIEIAHGTTVATNAILERKLAKTAFVTNAGFRDLLTLARQTRPELYALEPRLPRPPVSSEDSFTVPGRILPDGSILDPLDVSKLPDLSAYDAVAVCLLFSFANPEHELAIESELLAKRPGQFISLSHRVSPEMREYERATATAFNAAIGPIMARYIEAIDAVAPTTIMSSAGGLISTEDACAMPIRTITSGPAAGVIAASELAQSHGIARSISFDMGGTSTDVSIVDGGPTFTSLAEIDGLPIRQRRLDIHTVGCGGGSIAWLDAAGALQVGPKSVGADPGPAFWGIGSELSVSDANFVLGRLRLESLAGNATRQVRSERTLQAAAKLAEALGLTIENACERVVEAAEAGICAAIRKISSKRGFDPADFVLTAFGGSGGLHACAVANALGIGTVLIPQSAGVFSAVGLLRASTAWEESLSVIGRDADWRKTYELLEEDARRHVSAAGADAVRTADMRYNGQSHEIEVLATGNLDDAKAAFRRVHFESFGVVFDQRAIEWVTARVRVETAMRSIEQTLGQPTEMTANDGEVFWQGSRIACRIFAGTPNEAAGAALILLEGSTIFVPPGWRSMRLADGVFRLSRR